MLHGDKPARRQAPKHQNKRSFHAILPLVVLHGMVSAPNPPAESSIGSTVDSRRIVNRPLSPASIRVSKRRGNLSPVNEKTGSPPTGKIRPVTSARQT